MGTTPQPLWPPRPTLDWRTANNYVGKTVSELCADHVFLVRDGSSITRMRMTGKIKAIRVKKAYQANIHILLNNGEWILLLQPFPATDKGTETIVCMLSAGDKNRIEMFGM